MVVNRSSEPSRFDRVEAADGVFQVREDAPAPRIGAGLLGWVCGRKVTGKPLCRRRKRPLR